MSAVLKPSPNETARMMQDELQRRRRARILQVREQEKTFALRIRRAIQEKEKLEIDSLTKAFRKEWTQKHETALKVSEEKFATSLKDVGSAHEQAKENEPNQALLDAKKQQTLKTAHERGRSAIQHERDMRMKEEEESAVSRKRRHIALIREKLRARHIANLPPPTPNPADTFLNSTSATGSSESWSSGSIPDHPQRYTTIQVSDHNSTMPTMVSLGLPSNAVVERATAAEASSDARADAVKEGERIHLLQAERDRAIQECMEKAKVRHQAALDRARLDQERKDLMDDLKQIKAKDALRRQYHIEYSWDSNAKMAQACNEIFGPPGSKFRESELFSTDLKKDEAEESTSDVEESFDEYTIPKAHEEHPGWTVAEKENQDAPPPRQRALGKLLKQIEQQREQRKRNDEAISSEVRESSVPQTLNSISSIAADKTEAESSTSSEETLEESTFSSKQPAQEEASKEPPRIPAPTFTATATTLLQSKPTSTVAKGHDHTAEASRSKITRLSPQKLPAVKRLGAPGHETRSAIGLTAGTSYTGRADSESVLGRTLETVRNDEALLQSVKDFQERILQQHKSCAKIKEQIQRLEAKKANLDCLVTDITKPKSF